jgi:hypothetical protein
LPLSKNYLVIYLFLFYRKKIKKVPEAYPAGKAVEPEPEPEVGAAVVGAHVQAGAAFPFPGPLLPRGTGSRLASTPAFLNILHKIVYCFKQQ